MNTTIIASLSLLLIILFLTPQPTSSQYCQRLCGQIPLKYPFGSAPGCGDPRFQPYLTCDTSNQALAFHTKKASYPVTSIDYPTRTIYLTDPSMSTCRDGPTCQPSRGFALDWDAPFSFHDETLFALLGCSAEDSPLLSNATVKARLCDQRALPICGFLSSCRAIAATVTASDDIDNNALSSACCVYAPVDLGPAFEMDLEKLRCRSYSGFYGFRGRQSDPESWKYGVALEYKFGVYDDFPSYCDECEKSFGVCGYVGEYNSFVCNCPSGLNTTSDCLFGYSSHGGSKLLLPWNGLLGMLPLFMGLFSF